MYFIGVFLFSVNAYVYIPMMLLFMVKNCYKFSRMGIQGECFFLLEILRSCPRVILQIFMIVNF